MVHIQRGEREGITPYSKHLLTRTLFVGFRLILFLFYGCLARNQPESVLKSFLKLLQKQCIKKIGDFFQGRGQMSTGYNSTTYDTFILRLIFFSYTLYLSRCFYSSMFLFLLSFKNKRKSKFPDNNQESIVFPLLKCFTDVINPVIAFKIPCAQQMLSMVLKVKTNMQRCFFLDMSNFSFFNLFYLHYLKPLFSVILCICLS